MAMIGEVTPVLLDHTRRELAWLADLGFTESASRSLVTGQSFHLRFSSEHVGLLFSVDLAHREVIAVLWPRGLSREQGVNLNGFLGVRGLPLTNGKLRVSPIEAAREGIDRHVRALAQLRDHELAGDWTEYENARDHVRALKKAAYERARAFIRDPALRDVLERQHTREARGAGRWPTSASARPR